jgi:N-acetylneuraminic acid mutarotase
MKKFFIFIFLFIFANLHAGTDYSQFDTILNKYLNEYKNNVSDSYKAYIVVSSISSLSRFGKLAVIIDIPDLIGLTEDSKDDYVTFYATTDTLSNDIAPVNVSIIEKKVENSDESDEDFFKGESIKIVTYVSATIDSGNLLIDNFSVSPINTTVTSDNIAKIEVKKSFLNQWILSHYDSPLNPDGYINILFNLFGPLGEFGNFITNIGDNSSLYRTGMEAFKDPAPDNITFILDDQTMARGAAFVINGTLYHISSDNSIYKLENGQFSKYFTPSEDVFNILQTYTVAVLNNKAYIIGGLKDDGCKVKVPSGAEYNCATDEVWIFDPEKKTLELSDAHINKARDVAASGVVNNKIYLLAGWYPNDKGKNEDTVEVYDNGKWETINYSGTFYPVRSAAYATVGDKIYLIGGCQQTCQEQLLQEFDTTTNSFKQLSSMPLDGRHFSGQNACVRDNRYIYVYGGATDFSDKIFDDVAVYDTKTDQWKILDTHLTMPRKDIASAVIDDQLWIFGGATYFENNSNSENAPHANYNNQTIEYGIFY